METESNRFLLLNEDVFSMVDFSLDTNDYQLQAMIISDLFDECKTELTDFDVIRISTMFSSLVCSDDDDFFLNEDGFMSEKCEVSMFSDKVDDILMSDPIKVEGFIIDKLLKRERYELLKELKDERKNS